MTRKQPENEICVVAILKPKGIRAQFSVYF
jgi:hypothetical protein